MGAMRIVDLIGKLPQARPWPFRAPSRITRVVVHHSAAQPAASDLQQLRAFARHHIAQGWRGLAYHFAIAPDGTVYKCNAISSLTSHAKGGNTDSIGVMLLGNFDTHRYIEGKLLPSKPTPAQLSAARVLIAQLRESLASLRRVVGHRDVQGSRTACPGRYFTSEMIKSLWS